MLAVERKLKIAEVVEKNGGIKTSDLSSMFNVSEMTILRDLAILEDEGYLKRVYGGAVKLKRSSVELSTGIRKHLNPEKKDIIAEKAIKFIGSDTSIFLDSSTTAQALAKKINEGLNLTVITNSIDILNILKDNSSIKKISCGGELHQITGSFLGPFAENFLRDIFAEKAFVSAAGFSLKAGITVENPLQASLKKIMLENSLKKVVLVDSTKFDNIKLSKVCDINCADIVITDCKPPDSYIKYFKQNKVEIIY
ncbi:MAG: DeoR/GlpR transcriptional regulator [Actinobacteria bacterium]|nr:DeoR/GlpR transcriptional regulator [Actinomycetota bacterium]